MSCNNDVQLLIDELLIALKNNRNIKEIRLFGSQCKCFNPKSDVDILIILKNERKNNSIYKKISELIKKYNILIHPVIFTKKEFKMRKNMQSFNDIFLINSHLLYKKKFLF